MNLVDYDSLINHFTDLLQKCFKESDRWEDSDTYSLSKIAAYSYSLGKAAAYLDVVKTLTELKNEGAAAMQNIAMDNFDNVWEFYEACIKRGLAPIEDYADVIELYTPYINIGEELLHE